MVVVHTILRGFEIMRALAFLVVALACYRPPPQTHAGAEAVRVASASAHTAADQLCRATVKGIDVSDWEEIAADGFTFCVPSDGRRMGDTWRSATTRLAWGTRPASYNFDDPTVFSKADVSFDPRDQTIYRVVREDIGGRKTHIGIAHDGRFSTAYAFWSSPSVWLKAESEMLPGAEAIQLTIFRTVRFVDSAK